MSFYFKWVDEVVRIGNLLYGKKEGFIDNYVEQI